MATADAAPQGTLPPPQLYHRAQPPASAYSSKLPANTACSDRPSRRKPFAQWVKNLTNLKSRGHDPQEKTNSKNGEKTRGRRLGPSKTNKNGHELNNPYPQSGVQPQRRQSPVSSLNGPLSGVTSTSRIRGNGQSEDSLSGSAYQDREARSITNRSGAPTLATNAETIDSDAGHSKAPTTNTQFGALSDGAGHDSTFSSPAQSQHSLTTTLTTIQSTSATNALNPPSGANATATHHGSLNNPSPVMFSHQYPVTPAQPTPNTISAIPRYVVEQPRTYDRATANGLLTDNASILTLASSSKRRRRSYESQTDASVRALAPSSVFGGSRESLPLSVLSGNPDRDNFAYASQSRRSIGGIGPTERASIYSGTSGVAAPALASGRNSYYSHSHKLGKDITDAKSLRSITNIDGHSQYDTKSINADARSLADVASLKNYEGSTRSGALGHGRQDSIPGSSYSPAATTSPGYLRQLAPGAAVSRRSSEYRDPEEGAEAKNGPDQDTSTDETNH